MKKRLSTLDILARKGSQPLVVLTCYTAPMAKILDGNVDILLVGDSLGNVIYGLDSTLNVSLEMMIAHGTAVARHAQQSMVVVDMPFGSYQASKEDAFRACARVMAETGAQAIKLEGGEEMAETIHFLTRRGIPVMGHIGLMPQHFNALGGFRTQGRTDAEAAIILADAKAVAQAGAFSIVMEGVKEDVARYVTASISMPTIGIGASNACDGQVLVIDDMLGLTDRVPGFVKRYANLAEQIKAAVTTYSDEVKARSFPDATYVFPYKK